MKLEEEMRELRPEGLAHIGVRGPRKLVVACGIYEGQRL